MINIIAIFGKAGSGKDTILSEMLDYYPELNLHKIVADTSRPMREGESNGKQYNFVSVEDFKKNIDTNRMLEYTVYNDTWYYGTNVENLSGHQINIGIFNPNSIKQLMKNEEIRVFPVMIHADEKTRLNRQLNRETDPNCYEICRRFIADEEDFNKINFDYHIIRNEKLSLSSFALAKLIKLYF